MPISQKIKGVHYVKREFAICAQLCYGYQLLRTPRRMVGRNVDTRQSMNGF